MVGTKHSEEVLKRRLNIDCRAHDVDNLYVWTVSF